MPPTYLRLRLGLFMCIIVIDYNNFLMGYVNETANKPETRPAMLPITFASRPTIRRQMEKYAEQNDSRSHSSM